MHVDWVDILLEVMHACIYVCTKSDTSPTFLLCIFLQFYRDLPYACSELRHRFKSETDVTARVASSPRFSEVH
jgi:hypothetical protein